MPVKKINYEILPYGDSAFLVQFQTDAYSEAVTNHIHALIARLGRQKNWEELVPGYNSLLAYFCPLEFAPSKARAALVKALTSAIKTPQRKGKVLEIPVCYGGKYGPDMDAIQKTSGLSEKDIIKLHSKKPYKVCMMGFVPGFTFLSEVAPALQHPRRTTPRAEVPQGSVGIAGWQTGIYGLTSPGGWQIIGRTHLKIFDRNRKTPFLLKTGDQVKFVPIAAQDLPAGGFND